MRRKYISDAIGGISEKYTAEAAAYAADPARARRSGWRKTGIIAACFAAVMILGAWTLEAFKRPTLLDWPGWSRPYRDDVEVYVEEIGIVYPWEYLTKDERYTSMTFGGSKYTSRCRTIDEAHLGEVLGNCEAVAYENDYGEGTVTEHKDTFEVRRIRDLSSDLFVAVDLDGEYYVFLDSAIRDEYDPPATLGEFLDIADLLKTAELRYHTKYDGYTAEGVFNLKNDDGVWEILSECADAEAVDEEPEMEGKRFSFTLTSEKLGIYKKSFQIRENGYLWTNAFEWGYVYYIGEDAAGEIIEYVTNNSSAAQYEAYEYWLAGNITEIGDGYVMIDDSVLCKDPADGMTFKIVTEDLRVSRCIDYQGIKVGDFVKASFDGVVDDGNVVHGVTSIGYARMIDKQ